MKCWSAEVHFKWAWTHWPTKVTDLKKIKECTFVHLMFAKSNIYSYRKEKYSFMGKLNNQHCQKQAFSIVNCCLCLILTSPHNIFMVCHFCWKKRDGSTHLLGFLRKIWIFKGRPTLSYAQLCPWRIVLVHKCSFQIANFLNIFYEYP